MLLSQIPTNICNLITAFDKLRSDLFFFKKERLWSSFGKNSVLLLRSTVLFLPGLAWELMSSLAGPGYAIYLCHSLRYPVPPVPLTVSSYCTGKVRVVLSLLVLYFTPILLVSSGAFGLSRYGRDSDTQSASDYHVGRHVVHNFHISIA